MLIRSANYIGLGFYFIATTTFANRGSPRSTIPVETCPTAWSTSTLLSFDLVKNYWRTPAMFKNMTTPLILCPDFSTWKLPTVGFKQKFNYMFCSFRDVHFPPPRGCIFSSITSRRKSSKGLAFLRAASLFLQSSWSVRSVCLFVYLLACFFIYSSVFWLSLCLLTAIKSVVNSYFYTWMPLYYSAYFHGWN